jgi:hypothetical protein
MEKTNDRHPFFSNDEAGRFRSQWQQIQQGFVDDPRAATEKADALVAGVTQRLAEVFAQERGRLEGQWSRGGEVTTEDLRVALQRYRAFFDRLLSVSAGLEAETTAKPVPPVTSRPAATAAGAHTPGAAGHEVAETLDPKNEDEYWRRNYATRPYVQKGVGYDSYRPAYQYGWESYARHRGRRFEEVEPTLRRDWETRGRTGWDGVRDAVRDAWHRVERAIPGDADRDGR